MTTMWIRIRDWWLTRWQAANWRGKAVLVVAPLLLGCCALTMISTLVSPPDAEPTAEVAERAAARMSGGLGYRPPSSRWFPRLRISRDSNLPIYLVIPRTMMCLQNIDCRTDRHQRLARELTRCSELQNMIGGEMVKYRVAE